MFKKDKYNWKSSILSPDHQIKDAITNLNKTNLQIVLISKKNKLVGTITDGDIRRSLLKGYSLNEKVSKIMKKNFINVNQKISYTEAKDIMRAKSILQIPILSKDKKIVGLHIWSHQIFTKKKTKSCCYHGRWFWKKNETKDTF